MATISAPSRSARSSARADLPEPVGPVRTSALRKSSGRGTVGLDSGPEFHGGPFLRPAATMILSLDGSLPAEFADAGVRGRDDPGVPAAAGVRLPGQPGEPGPGV